MLTLLLVAGLTLAAAPAQGVRVTFHAAQAHTHYDETSRHVANELGCKRFRGHGGGGTVYKTGVCWLKGKRVNVITFRSAVQQRYWNVYAKEAFGPRFFWGNGKGALVVARNGNRPAAKLGARLLPGRLVHG